MFQLKEGRRPLIFLLTITLENLGLLGIWFLYHLAYEAAQCDEGTAGHNCGGGRLHHLRGSVPDGVRLLQAQVHGSGGLVRDSGAK